MPVDFNSFSKNDFDGFEPESNVEDEALLGCIDSAIEALQRLKMNIKCGETYEKENNISIAATKLNEIIAIESAVSNEEISDEEKEELIEQIMSSNKVISYNDLLHKDTNEEESQTSSNLLGYNSDAEDDEDEETDW